MASGSRTMHLSFAGIWLGETRLRTIVPRLCLIAVLAGLASGAAGGTFEDCVVREVMSGDVQRSAHAIRTLCDEQTTLRSTTIEPAPLGEDDESAVGYRRRMEVELADRDFAISTYQPTYIMFTSNENFDANKSIYAGFDPDFASLEKEEMKFQVSAKFPLWRNMIGQDTDLYLGYTQTSWWQLFADEGITSAPFRETNYQPEVFLRHYSAAHLPFGGQISGLDFGLVHESNGRSQPLSRSWNRLMGRAVVEYGNIAFLGRIWYRLPEDDEDDDNPGEYRYLGYGDLRAVWTPNKNTFSAMVRPGTEEIGTELTWSYPISNSLRVYAQWWYGYGESLIDYDQKVNRFGIGIAVNDWLMR